MKNIPLAELLEAYLRKNADDEWVTVIVTPTGEREGLYKVDGVSYWYRMENYTLNTEKMGWGIRFCGISFFDMPQAPILYDKIGAVNSKKETKCACISLARRYCVFTQGNTDMTKRSHGCGKKIAITNSTGFRMTFANGWTASVVFGRGTYSSNRYDDADYISQTYYGSDRAEVYAWKGREALDDVRGYQTADQVAAFLAEIAAL